jgi:hypothetical protein
VGGAEIERVLEQHGGAGVVAVQPRHPRCRVGEGGEGLEQRGLPGEQRPGQGGGGGVGDLALREPAGGVVRDLGPHAGLEREDVATRALDLPAHERPQGDLEPPLGVEGGDHGALDPQQRGREPTGHGGERRRDLTPRHGPTSLPRADPHGDRLGLRFGSPGLRRERREQLLGEVFEVERPVTESSTE